MIGALLTWMLLFDDDNPKHKPIIPPQSLIKKKEKRTRVSVEIEISNVKYIEFNNCSIILVFEYSLWGTERLYIPMSNIKEKILFLIIGDIKYYYGLDLIRYIERTMERCSCGYSNIAKESKDNENK